MEKVIILRVLFAVFIIAAITPRIIQKLKKVETVGCIGIDRKIFFLGKVSLFTSFILIHVQLQTGKLSLFSQSDIFFWICMLFVGVGVVFFTLAILKLGTFSLRVGLAKNNTALRTTGIYGISRNPMLFGLYLMSIGSAIYVQNPINWMLVIIALTIHHKIIRTEEVYMANRFGEDWLEYRNKVPRYI